MTSRQKSITPGIQSKTLLCIGLVLLTGCTLTPIPRNDDPVIVTSTPTINQTQSVDENTPYSSTIEVSPTVSSSPAPTDTPPTIQPDACSSMRVTDFSSVSINGTVIFRSFRTYPWKSWTSNGLSAFFPALDKQAKDNETVSPNHEWIAFATSEYDQEDNYLGDYLIVTRADEQGYLKIPWKESWASEIVDWRNNEELILLPAGTPYGGIIIYNPFTDEMKTITPSYPWVLYQDWWGLHYWNYSLSIYDPSLTRAITYSDGRLPDEGITPPTMTLWDTTDMKELWSIEDSEIPGQPAPIWSSDGSFFLFPASNGDLSKQFTIMKVTKEGVMTQLFDNRFPFSAKFQLALSPDDRYLTIAPDRNGSEVELYLFDMVENSFIPTCLSAHGYDHVTWSPEGTQFIVQETGQNDIQPVLYDIKQRQIAYLNEDVYILGWLKNVEQNNP